MILHVFQMSNGETREEILVLPVVLSHGSRVSASSYGGGVGIGYSIHAGQVIVADGTPEAARRLERVLSNDPDTGAMRHIDAGYEEAIECAQERGVKIPML